MSSHYTLLSSFSVNSKVHTASISWLKGPFIFDSLLKLGYLWRQQLPLLSSGVTFAVIFYVLWKSENVLLNFELSVDFFYDISITTVPKKYMPSHSITHIFLVWSSTTSTLPPLFITFFFGTGSLSSSTEDSWHHS